MSRDSGTPAYARYTPKHTLEGSTQPARVSELAGTASTRSAAVCWASGVRLVTTDARCGKLVNTSSRAAADVDSTGGGVSSSA